MHLIMNTDAAQGYTSGSQIARRITEQWAAENLYCAACDSDAVSPSPCNTEAVDFNCPNCSEGYQLKASRMWNERRVPDAGYDAMMRAIRADATPNLFVMQYSPDWTVQNLVLIPSFFFVASSIEKRKPLSATARRAGWIGCNILLHAIAPEGKLRIVSGGRASLSSEIRDQYSKVCPLADVAPSVRGWTLDVLRVVRGLRNARFCLDDVYKTEGELARLHPANLNIRPKIRQQLQVLRDLGMVQFLGRGCYELTDVRQR